MGKQVSTSTLIRLDDHLDQRISDTYIELAKLFGKSTPSWLPSWIESFLLPTGQHDVRIDKSRPSRSQRLKTLKSDKDLTLRALQTARASCDEPSVKRLTLNINQIEAETSRISRAKGGAKPGPNKGTVTPKDLMAARLVELHLFVKGKEPSARNQKLAKALVNLLHTLGTFRVPSGNPLNGSRKAFEAARSVSGKVNDVGLRMNDALHDEIVVARLLTRRSLKQCEKHGRASWIISGMNGPVRVYNAKN